MKKFIAIILVIMLAFSMLLITACNNNTADTDDDQFTSLIEESSSGRKRGEGAGSDAPNTPGTTSEDDNPTTPGGDDEPGGGDDDPQTPPDTEFEYGNYDYTYQNIPTEPADLLGNAGIFDSLMCTFYNDYSKPELSDDFYSVLVDNESIYNSLTATEKGAVQNYAFLQEARTAYNNMAKQECEKLISALPDASTENIDEFSIQSKAIQNLINNLGNEANNIPNKATYDQKVAQIDSIFIASFNQKVAELRAFEYTPAYKAKLDSAEAFYEDLSATQKAAVSSSHSELTNLKTKYEDTGVVNSFNEVYNKLPAPSNVVKEDKTNIELARTMYNKMSASQLQLLGDFNAILTNLNALKTAINVLCPEYVWARSLETNKGSRIKTFENSTLKYDFSGSSTNSSSAVFTYDGKSLTESFTYNANGAFKMTGVPYGGKLVLYVGHYNNNTVNVTVTGGAYTETKELPVNEPLEFNIPSGGDYTISFSDKVKVYAVVFS